MNSALYAIRYHRVTMAVIVLIVLVGIMGYFKLGRLEDPEYTIKEAVISTEYPGATALEVEQEVTEVVETAIQQLKQLKEVRSISRAGRSIVIAEMQEIYDKETLPQVWDELRRKVASVQSALPPGCGVPHVNDDFGDVYGMFFAISGDGYSLHDLKEVAKDLRKELLLCPEVGKIDFQGMPSDAVYVEIDRERLANLGLNPNAMFEAIKEFNTVRDAGRIRVGREDIRLRVNGDYDQLADMGEQLIHGGTGGRTIRIRDIAVIRRGNIEPAEMLLRFNGKPAVGMGISTVSGGNVIAMGNGVRKRLNELRSRIPAGIEIQSIADQAATVDDAVRGFTLNLLESTLIVIGLLLIFMGVRAGLVIGSVLVLTIMGTLGFMLAMDITLQRISLGALIIALGMLVDNAIVVSEEFMTKIKAGLLPEDAAVQTVKATQWPLLGATLIAILAFAAISLSKDMTGEWLKSLFQTICLSLGLSWVLAITVTPYLCVRYLGNIPEKPETSSSGKFFQCYRKWVTVCINHRRITLTIVFLVWMIAMGGFSRVKQDFMPDMNRPQFTVDIWMPEGTHIDATAAVIDEIGEFLRQQPGVTGTAGVVGGGALRFLLTYEPQMPNSAYGQLLVGVDDFRKIAVLAPRVIEALTEKYPQAVVSVDSFKLGPGGGMVEARLIGPDIKVLRRLASQVDACMRSTENTRCIRNDWGNLVLSERLETARERAAGIGVGRAEIAMSAAMNFSGSVVGSYRENDELLPIVMRAPQSQRKSIDELDNLQVWSGAGSRWLPVGQVCDGRKSVWEDPVIRRLNRMRTMSVSCKAATGTTDGLFRRLKPQIENIQFPPDYHLEWGGEHKAATDANRKLMSKVPLAFVAMLMIAIMLFNTFRHPLIIFMGMPLAMVGVAPAMLLADKAFGFMAMLGVLSLSGMLIKNEIVLLDQIKIELDEGRSPYDAVLNSAVSRLRPVCMAAFTTVLGMIPLLWDAFFAPMAVAIIGGLTVSTVLTLVVVPVLYCFLFKVNQPLEVLQ
jgi:multidrug efflux pump subunit AcrB